MKVLYQIGTGTWVVAGAALPCGRQPADSGFPYSAVSPVCMRSAVMMAIKRTDRCFSVIGTILKKESVSDDFKYLAVIESSLDERACLPAKAYGMWRFMEGTAREYGMDDRLKVKCRFV